METNNKTVKAYAPASIGNVSCGFDVLGMAVDAPGDEVELTLTTNEVVAITKIVGDGGRLPLVAEQNTASVAVQSFLKSINSTQGVDIVLYKNLPAYRKTDPAVQVTIPGPLLLLSDCFLFAPVFLE